MCDYHTIVYIILVPFEVCKRTNVVNEVRPLHNVSGYVFCTYPNKGIKQLCPLDTELSYEIGGCVNKTSKCKTK